jgi:subtilase family serine protease
MKTTYPRTSTTIFIFSLLAGSAYSQVAPRLPLTIDESRVTRIAGTTHSRALPANETGRAAAALPMSRILLVLKAPAAQESQLEALLAAQQDPASPQFHKWLTPQQFGQQFGVAQQDIDTISRWLAGRGLQVNGVANGRRAIEFSGTASQVEQAFHTEMHHYLVNGATHLANSTDISIPSSLATVVSGVASLNDFLPEPLHRTPVPLSSAPASNANARPQFNASAGTYAVSPGDFATIYNIAPLYSAGVNGTGQTVAIVGRTNFNMSDVTTFRSTFGLPVNNPRIVLNGANPGIVSQDEATEALLDVEWSGAVAPDATIEFVLSASTNTTGGETLSAEYIVDNNLAPVLSTSFGLCEAEMGSGNQLYASLWQQAAAQGISVSVAVGDSGSAGCDAPGSTSPASHGLAVSGIASTPYNTAVGGTQLNESGNYAAYWAGANTATYSTALSYIPELVWNDSAFVSAGSASNNLYAGSGGVSTLYATPSWQTGAGVPGMDPNTAGQHHRYIPDISFSAASHDPYVIVQNGSLMGVGGTSAGAPAFAGVMALLNQHLKGPVGNPAQTLYSIEAQYPAAFHDVVSGNDAVPCSVGSANCNATSSSIGTMAGWSAGAGYDLATGLGSVNAYNLIMNWPGAAQAAAPAISALSPNPMTGSASSQTLTINGSGFQSGLKVLVTAAGTTTTYQGTGVTLTGSSQAQISVVTGVAAATWSVQVVNASSQASNTAVLTINAPAHSPVLSSLSPNPMTGSASAQTLTINGSGFVSGTGLEVVFTASNGAATTIPASSITFLSSSQLQTSIIVGTAAETWSVKVVNPGGLASNTVTFAVTVAGSTPVISSLNPASLAASNSYQTLSINGSGFQSGAGLELIVGYPGGSTIIPSSSIQFVSTSQLKLSIDVGTAARTLTFQVVDPNGQKSNLVALVVQ